MSTVAGLQMAMDDEGGFWVSASEAARILGCTRQAIQKRIVRGTIETTVNNRGERLVRAVAGAAPVTRKLTPVTERHPATPVRVDKNTPKSHRVHQDAPGLASLSEVRALLGEQHEAHRAAIDALARQHRDAMDMMRERTDAAELRAEGLAEKLDDLMDRMTRPWWSRWLGHSKKSDLG